MTTISKLVDTLNTTIDEANTDIEKLEQCNECMATTIEENSHLISWNRGCVDHAEFTLEEIEKGQKTAIREAKQPDQDIRIRLASALHDMMMWTKSALNHPNVDRDVLDKPLDELDETDRHLFFRLADDILDVLRGEQ